MTLLDGADEKRTSGHRDSFMLVTRDSWMDCCPVPHRLVTHRRQAGSWELVQLVDQGDGWRGNETIFPIHGLAPSPLLRDQDAKSDDEIEMIGQWLCRQKRGLGPLAFLSEFIEPVASVTHLTRGEGKGPE